MSTKVRIANRPGYKREARTRKDGVATHVWTAMQDEKRWARPYTGDREPVITPGTGQALSSPPAVVESETHKQFDATDADKQFRHEDWAGREQVFLLRRFLKPKGNATAWLAYAPDGTPNAAIWGHIRDGGLEVTHTWLAPNQLAADNILCKLLEQARIEHIEVYSNWRMTRAEQQIWKDAGKLQHTALDKVIAPHRGKDKVRYRLRYEQPRMLDVEQVATNEDFEEADSPQLTMFSIGGLLERGRRFLKSTVKAHTRHVGGKAVQVRAYTDKRTRKPTSAKKIMTKRGNVQYVYDEKTLAAAKTAKFQRVAGLAEALPEILDRVNADLSKGDTPKEKVCAAVVALIDRCKFRIGTEKMAKQHGTYGVATLKPEHVSVSGNRVRFQFTGKKQVPWDKAVTDKSLAQFVQHLADGSPGEQLFWYHDGNKQRPLRSGQVNAYLEEFGVTAKDFRTYHATRLMFNALNEQSRKKGTKKLSKREVGKRVKAALGSVAKELGHTPAVCKSSYVLPAIIKDFEGNGGRLTLEDAWEKV